jgi:superfamily II DNA or RNA helicase
MDALFEAVRAACSTQTWSRGVELARGDNVVGEHADPGEVRVRVALRGGMIARHVTLWPGDDDWECSCGGPRGCEHAAAAVIALRRAAENGLALPEPRWQTGRVSYRLSRVPGGIALERGIRTEERWHPFEATIAALAERRVEAPPFTAGQADLNVELALGTHRRGPVPSSIVERLLASLSKVDELLLDGEPVTASPRPVLPRVAVEDQDEGFRLVLEEDPDVTERFANGMALCGATLRPTAEPALTARERDDLVRGLSVTSSEVPRLVTEVLPSLRKRMPVDVRTERLPATEFEPPRVALDVSRRGDTLRVLATLVYGDPPRGRVDGERLVHLRGTVPLRDRKAEARLVARLASELGISPGVGEEYEGAEAVEAAERLRRWEGVPPAPLAPFRRLEALRPRFRVVGDDFDLSFEVGGETSSGTRRADPGEVLRAWREGASLVPILGGGWAPLPADWLGRFGAAVADLLAAREAAGSFPRSALPDLARVAGELGEPAPPSFAGLRAAVEGFEAIPACRLPGDLRAELRPYQRRGVDWLVFLGDTGLGALLADDMGLGKTLQALCALRGRTLVVAPTSVLPNWMDEIAKFRPGLRASLYHGPRRSLDEQAEVVVTSFALLRLDEDVLAGREWDTVVLDEAHAIKNPESRVAAAAHRLRTRFPMALTGTSVENRLEELWSIFRFTHPGLLGGLPDFRDRYVRPVESGDEAAAAGLRRRIRPFLLRRLKEDVAPELPPRTEAVLHCELTEDERKVYDAVRAATVSEVVRRLQTGGSVLAALEALLRLRQAACHPSLVPGHAADTSSKVELLLESLETVVSERHKALVFSQWTSLLDLVEGPLAAAGVGHVRLDGSTVDRRGVVARFQDPAGPPVMLVSLKAGGTGLNLTAADHVFLMDPWWNPAVEDQAADRAHRIGQDKPVFVYRLVSEDTVETKILALQESKRRLAEAALDEGAAAASLTRDDLLELLS